LSSIRKNSLFSIILLFSIVGSVSAECTIADCPIIITNVYELQAMQDDLGAWYELGCDIDASETTTWNGGAGFEPVGTFTGIFDGQGHTITGIYINRPATKPVGLFKDIANRAEIRNVDLADADVTGYASVGSLLGYNNDSTVFGCSSSGNVRGIESGGINSRVGGLVGMNTNGALISQCYSTANVTSPAWQVGGLTGYNGHGAIVIDCYARGNVSGRSKVGGLVGDNLYPEGGYVKRCYSTGKITGSGGGLIGYNFSGGITYDSYWDRETSGIITSYGGTPKTTAEMMQQVTFVNWDYDNVWHIIENESYPFLRGPVIKYYVDDDAPDDPCHGVPGASAGEPGLSDPFENGTAEHPFDSIQKAVDDFSGRDCSCCSQTIVLLDGIYTELGNYNIDLNGLVIRIKSQNEPDNCIIDCNRLGKGFIFQNGEKNCTLLDGVTIINGYADECAGAIDCNNSSPTINNCIIEGNYAGWSGGAIFCQDSDAEITNCTITDNFCEASGAGICGVRGFPVIKNCLITNNDGYFSGAASSVYDCNMTIINCTIADNVASHPYLSTGGIYCWEGDANIINTIVWNNNSPDNEQIEFFMGNEVCKVTYSDVQIEDSNLVWEGTGNLNDDPCFAAPESGDYHLKSTAGRWAQILDSAADLNNDDIVNQLDLKIFIDYWLYTGEEIYIDLYREESIDFKDFAVLASNWLEDGLLDADFDESSFVDCNDLGIFTEYWLDTGREIPVDLYYEASIDFKDYAVLALDWLRPGWTYSDTETSLCIDAGDPAYDYTLEPEPNGERINMGAYGNTEYASKSPYSDGE